MVISDSGLVSWNPDDGVTSSDVVTIILEDNGGSEGVIKNDTEAFEVDITQINDAPEVISVAPDSAYEDIEYIYQVNVEDPDNDSFNFTLTNAPDGMIVSDSGLITWTALEGVLTSGEVTLTVSDGELVAEEIFTVTVAAVNDVPVITSTATLNATEDIEYVYQVIVDYGESYAD